jgi:hypothetical protein
LRRIATASALAGRLRSPRTTAVRGEQRDAFGGALCRDRLQPHRIAVTRKGLRERLDELDVVTASRADRDLQRHRTQPVEQQTCGDGEHEDAGRQDQERRVSPFEPAARGAGMFTLLL